MGDTYGTRVGANALAQLCGPEFRLIGEKPGAVDPHQFFAGQNSMTKGGYEYLERNFK